MALNAGLQLALSDYLTQTRRLLRDPSALLYSDADLTEFINRAMRQRDMDLGLNRVKISFTLTASTFAYSFSTIIATGTVSNGNSNLVLMDVLSIIVIPLGGSTSSVRYPMERWPYSRLAPLLSTSYPTYPVAYALYGSAPPTIFLGPPPAGAYPCEIDMIGYAQDLVASSDQDQAPYPFTDPIPFLAASFAKISVQRFDEADEFLKTYDNRIARVRGRARSIMVRDPWASLRRR